MMHKRSTIGLALVAAAVLAVAAAPAVAQEAPLVYYVEGGLDFVHHTNDYGNGNNQWVAFSVSRAASFNLRFDLGRSERFGDEGVGIGALFAKYLGRWTLDASVATGSGDFILPEYRVGAAVGYSFLSEANLQVTLAWIHEQSKAENYYDRISLGATWYFGSHWIFGGYFNWDIGQPGDTATKSVGLGATWFTWQERYIGGLVEYGDVNYTQVGVTDFLVAYEQLWVRLNYSEYFNPTMGMTVRVDLGGNEWYDFYGVGVSLFKSW